MHETQVQGRFRRAYCSNSKVMIPLKSKLPSGPVKSRPFLGFLLQDPAPRSSGLVPTFN